MNKPELTLYHFEACPYCQKVRRFITENKLNVTMKDIHLDPLAKEFLIQIGGKSQVPCLFIDGKALYESLDIIEWFTQHQVA